MEKATEHLIMDDLKATLSDTLEPVDRDVYNVRLERIKESLKKPLGELDITDLVKAFDVTKDHKEIITIACLIYTFKFGKPVSKAGNSYSYRPESFWGTSTFGTNSHFHVHKTMEEYFEIVPEKKSQWCKSLKTFARNLIKKGQPLHKLTGFIQFLYNSHIESQSTIIEYKHSNSIDIELNYEIPF